MAALQAIVAGDAAAFEQLCAMLMSSQNEQRSQVGRGCGHGAALLQWRRAALPPAGGPAGCAAAPWVPQWGCAASDSTALVAAMVRQAAQLCRAA